MTAEMTPRERVARAVEMRGPDRIPIHRYVMPGAFRTHGQKLVDLLNSLPDDFGVGRVEMPPEPDLEEMDSVDEWGVTWRHVKGIGYSVGEVKEPALPTWDGLKGYRFPPVPTFEDMPGRIRSEGHREYVFGFGATLFERMQWIRRTDNLFIDLAEDSDEVNVLADRLVEYFIAGMRNSLEAGADACYCGDDWGTQRALLINPVTWRKFFKPRYKRMFDAVREYGAHVWFHTDGWTWEILDDLIEIGMDVLNPQHHIMGDARVAEKIGGRVCVRSDLDRQGIIPLGTPEEVETHVKEIVALFASFNGGLILHGEVGPDVPFENIEAMYQASLRYGRYPLDL